MVDRGKREAAQYNLTASSSLRSGSNAIPLILPMPGNLAQATAGGAKSISWVSAAGTGSNLAFIRFRSGTRTVPVVRDADRTFQLEMAFPGGAHRTTCS
jgi:hypothetical protein